MMGISGRARAVFLDRDGTINEDVHFLRRLEDIRLLPGAAEAIRLLNEAGFKVVVVTNQSGIARGLLDEALLDKIHREIEGLISRSGAVIDAWYHCPHHPDQGPGGRPGPYTAACPCRKPAPGMLVQAASDLGLDLSGSFMVGDSPRDIEAARAAGTRAVLVLTGKGREAVKHFAGRGHQGGGEGDERSGPDYVASDLMDAALWICRAARDRGER